MNSLRIANLAWQKMIGFTFVEDWHRQIAVDAVINQRRNKKKEITDETKKRALVLLSERHERMKEAMKKLRECREPYTADNYQMLLREVGNLQRNPITEGD